jgi:hypothetical protein
MRAGAAGAQRPNAPGTQARIDVCAVPECLQLLARAIQQYRTYPPTSPLCRTAIQASHRAIGQLREEQLSLRITPREVIAGDESIGAGSLVEPEIARRLHTAGIAQVTIERAVSIRELSHFAADLIACSRQPQTEPGLIERLAEHGVDRIALRPAYRPEVLPVAAPSEPVADLLAAERDRRAESLASGGHAAHLYPPEKGWVCVDPSTRLPSVSLIDLALLAEDPSDLASMLVRLTDDDEGDGSDRGAALAEKFSDVSMLFSALDPRLARVMFSRLARAVLDLDSERRQALLRRTILPSLLDGGVDGTVLRDFPDVDLAESLCLLLDLETAAPDVVMTALARLDLEREREAAVLPLIDQRLQGRGLDRDELSLDAHARRLVRIDHRGGRSFAEFSAFDLSLDEAASQALSGIRDGLARADLVGDRLTCLWQLIRLEPNPERVQSYIARAEPLLKALIQQARWAEVSDWLSRVRGLADSSRDARPDVATVVEVELAALCGAEMVRNIVNLAEGHDEDRATAGRLVAAIGAGIGTALLTAMPRDGRSRGLVELLCAHARLLAPSLAIALGQVDDAANRIIVRVLGCAGPGHEDALAGLLASRDEQTVRETLRALARIGSSRAAALVGAEVRTRRDRLEAAAEQTLWQFPPAEAQREARALLARREFVLARPDVAARLLDRLAEAGAGGLEEMLRATSGLQYRFWNPSLSRLGRKARALLAR